MTIHSSLVSIVLSLIGPIMLGGLSVYWISTGSRGLVVALLVVSVVFMAVVLYDMPIVAVFNDRGVTRRTPLRDHLLEWESIERLSRTRARRAGLIAEVGRRKYVLADRAGLSPDEFDLLVRLRPS